MKQSKLYDIILSCLSFVWCRRFGFVLYKEMVNAIRPDTAKNRHNGPMRDLDRDDDEQLQGGDDISTTL